MDIGNTQQIETKANFARMMGWSRPYVTRLAQKGRIVLVGGKVDVHASLIVLKETASSKPHHIAHVEQLKVWRKEGLFLDVAASMKKWKEAEEKSDAMSAAKVQQKKQRMRLWRLSMGDELKKKDRERMANRYADPECRRQILDRRKVLKDSVPEWYARDKLGLSKNDAPAELVQAKRLHLLIKKQIRSLDDEKH